MEFDDRAYQLVVAELGSFDSIVCVDEALRRRNREVRGELVADLLDAVAPPEAGRELTPQMVDSRPTP